MNRGLLLLSGGIDSPVAGHLVQQSGAEIYAVHFSNKLFAGNEPEPKVKIIAKQCGFSKLFLVDLSTSLSALATKCKHAYYFVLMKRLMFRVAEQIALEQECDFLITGESLAQVSSQTLENLATIDSSIQLPVARPLLGLDKQEIINIAREIETYGTSTGKETCDALGPKHPIIHATNEKAVAQEDLVDIPDFVTKAMETIQSPAFL